MHDKTGIRWVRVIIAGLLTEICVIFVIVALITVYKLAVSPTDAEIQAFAGQVGCFAAALHVLLVVASQSGFETIYLIADALKLAGGALGGFVAQKRFS